MGKFNKLVEKMPQVDNKEAALKALVSFKNVIEEGIIHYLEKEKLDDFWKMHYTNSVVSWRKKLEKVNESIRQLKEGGHDVSVPPTPLDPEV